MAFGIRLFRHGRVKKKKKLKKKSITIERVLEGPLTLLDPKGDSTKDRKVWVMLSTESVSWSAEKDSTPMQKVFFTDMVGVHTKTSDHPASNRDHANLTGRSGLQSYRQRYPPTERDMNAKEALPDDELIISTYEKGYFMGQHFTFRAADRYERDIWWRCSLRVLMHCEKLDQAFERELPTYHMLLRWQRTVDNIYQGDRSQMFTAGLVCMATFHAPPPPFPPRLSPSIHTGVDVFA
jgi:hypothetical protein